MRLIKYRLDIVNVVEILANRLSFLKLNLASNWGQIYSQKHLKIQMIVLDKLDEDGMPITESVTTNEEEFEIVRDGKDFSVKF